MDDYRLAQGGISTVYSRKKFFVPLLKKRCMPRDYKVYLDDILEAIAKVQEYTKQTS